MTQNSGRRRNIPGDPTAESCSDPVPTGEDVGDPETREDIRGLDTPRRYEQPVEADPVMPSDGWNPSTKQ